MAINLNDNIYIKAGKPSEAKYLNGVVDYVSLVEVNSSIPIAERHVGLTVRISGFEYWYNAGIDDVDLVLKTSSQDGDLINIRGTYDESSGMVQVVPNPTFQNGIGGWFTDAALTNEVTTYDGNNQWTTTTAYLDKALFEDGKTYTIEFTSVNGHPPIPTVQFGSGVSQIFTGGVTTTLVDVVYTDNPAVSWGLAITGFVVTLENFTITSNSVATFPTNPPNGTQTGVGSGSGGAIEEYNSWKALSDLMIGSNDFRVKEGQLLVAKVDNPSPTDEGDWNVLEWSFDLNTTIYENKTINVEDSSFRIEGDGVFSKQRVEFVNDPNLFSEPYFFFYAFTDKAAEFSAPYYFQGNFSDSASIGYNDPTMGGAVEMRIQGPDLSFKNEIDGTGVGYDHSDSWDSLDWNFDDNKLAPIKLVRDNTLSSISNGSGTTWNAVDGAVDLGGPQSNVVVIDGNAGAHGFFLVNQNDGGISPNSGGSFNWTSAGVWNIQSGSGAELDLGGVSGNAKLSVAGVEMEWHGSDGITLSSNASVVTQSSDAIFELASDSKAMILTRIVDPALDINSPEEGMIVFNSTNKTFEGYDGADWSAFLDPFKDTNVAYASATHGDDTEALLGYSNKPFQTLTAAANALAALPTGVNKVLYAYPDDYPENGTVTLSGTNSNIVVKLNGSTLFGNLRVLPNTNGVHIDLGGGVIDSRGQVDHRTFLWQGTTKIDLLNGRLIDDNITQTSMLSVVTGTSSGLNANNIIVEAFNDAVCMFSGENNKFTSCVFTSVNRQTIRDGANNVYKDCIITTTNGAAVAGGRRCSFVRFVTSLVVLEL